MLTTNRIKTILVLKATPGVRMACKMTDNYFNDYLKQAGRFVEKFHIRSLQA